ncbi:phosphoinositide 3-kinase regulatory subunit 4 [Limosa lapponica baueri]|uniref:Phosphoinositide 3-kinase regulatory subunit 4 n=1 Tax=Limosa lapponica baueri TaxID=1758121 RepID=A0A2I0TTQ3_LIMLA|nr:phosphoinositide 3-kinase regulatory subunit 4 [Limosa lapponica baueri]
MQATRTIKKQKTKTKNKNKKQKQKTKTKNKNKKQKTKNKKQKQKKQKQKNQTTKPKNNEITKIPITAWFTEWSFITQNSVEVTSQTVTALEILVALNCSADGNNHLISEQNSPEEDPWSSQRSNASHVQKKIGQPLAIHCKITSFILSSDELVHAGCVIAELFTEGVPLFDLSQLLAYRNGLFSPDQVLNKIEDRSIRELVTQMVHREPDKRLAAEDYLKQQRNNAFPEIFYTFLQPYMAQFAKETFVSADERILVIRKDLDNIIHNLCGHDRTEKAEGETKENGLVILVSVITSCLQTLKYCDSKLAALELILHLAPRLSVEILLDRITPYLLHFSNDSVPRVRAESVRTLTKVLALVKEVPRNDINIYPEYILPGIAHLAQDEATIVRLAYAENIALLAETALRFLELVQLKNLNMENEPNGEEMDETSHPSDNYDTVLKVFDCDAGFTHGPVNK